MAEVILGSWAKVEEAIAASKADPDFPHNTERQANLLLILGEYYDLVRTPGVKPSDSDNINQERKNIIFNTVKKMIPRVKEEEKKDDLVEGLLLLSRDQGEYENLCRALEFRESQYEAWVPEPGEEIYPTSGWIGHYLRWCRHSEAPLAFNFWSAISALSAACKFNFYIDRGYFIRLHTYIVLVGDSSTGKGQAQSPLDYVIRRTNEIIDEEYGIAELSAEKEDPKAKKVPADHPYRIRLLANDVNVETMFRRLEYQRVTATLLVGKKRQVDWADVDSTGLLILDELVNFFGKGAWNVDKKVPFLTQVFSRPEYGYDTVKEGRIDLKNTAITMHACTAPIWIKTGQITQAVVRGGFYDRTIFIYRDQDTERSCANVVPLDPIMGDKLARWLVAVAVQPKGYRVRMIATPEADKFHKEWYDSKKIHYRENPDPNDRRQSLHRQSIHVWVLACLLAISYNEDPIVSQERVEEALKYLEAEAPYKTKFRSLLETPEGAKLHEYIIGVLERFYREGKLPIKRKDLLSTIRRKAEFDGKSKPAWEMVMTLADLGLVNITEEGKATYVTLIPGYRKRLHAAD